MKIESLSQLNKLLTLCRKHGVNIIKVDGMELVLEGKPLEQPLVASTKETPAVTPTYAPGGITEDTQIISDGLTEEQLLFYSSQTEQ